MKISTIVFAVAALSGAQSATAAPAPAPTKTPAAKPVVAVAAKPAPVAKLKAAKAVAATGRMVTTRTTTGKTITYNCSLAGNATKKACK
ncbi:hypothetical protein BH10PSE15_BH10PSE15_08160 [soil metagenome]